MAEPQAQNNIVQTDPQLKDALNNLKKEINLSLNCHHIAIVQGVNFEEQVLTAQIAYKKTFTQKDADGVYRQVLKDYPIVIDVPFVIVSGGLASLKMPIAVGDECLLLFNDRAIDNWWASGQNVGPSSSRLHSFSDAIALVGVRSLKRSLENYDPEAAELMNDAGYVRIKDNLIGIGNDGTTLLTVLSNLVTVLVGLSTTNTVPGAPATLSPATITALNNITTQLQGLLE